MASVFISLGSNIRDRLWYLSMAKHTFYKHPLLSITACSSIQETKPVAGSHPQPDFLNQVIQINTLLSPVYLLALLQKTEQTFHRKRERRWGPRTLDLDILTYGSLTLQTPALILPHPELNHRPFLQKAIREIAPMQRLIDIPNTGPSGLKPL